MKRSEAQEADIKDALRRLCDLLVQSGTEDLGPSHRGYYALAPETRLILTLLDEIDFSKRNEDRLARELARKEKARLAAEAEMAVMVVPESPEGAVMANAVDDAIPLAVAATPKDDEPAVAVPLSDEVEVAAMPTDPVPSAPPPAEVIEAAVPITAEPDLPDETPDPVVQAEVVAADAVIQPPDPEARVPDVSPPAVMVSAEPTQAGQPVMPERSLARTVPQAPAGLPPQPPVKRSINLKNARVDEAYDATVALDGLSDIRLQSDGGTGLVLDSMSHLTGKPKKSGDYVLKIQGLLDRSRCELSLNLTVIADPKSLWTSKPSDRDGPYWKEEQAFGSKDGDLLSVAGSKRGRSHARDGTYRDDDFGLFCGPAGGWQIAVVADGAGSAKYSRYGSELAVKTVLSELPGLLDQVVTPHLEALVDLHLQGNPEAERQIKSQLLYRSLAAVAFNAAKAIEEEAAAKAERAAAYSTTLIIGAAKQVKDKWFIAGFSIGDGGMAVFDVKDRSLKTLSLPDSGEYAGQTRFLHKSEFTTYENVERRLFFDVRPRFTAIALMTDGITDPKFPTDHAFADPAQWMEFWENDLSPAVDFSRNNRELKSQLMDWMDFWSPGNHDDRTLAILVP